MKIIAASDKNALLLQEAQNSAHVKKEHVIDNLRVYYENQVKKLENCKRKDFRTMKKMAKDHSVILKIA